MLSNRMTFSLTCLVMLLAVGLVFAPSATADHGDFGLSISAAETMVDVSSDDGMQIASGRDRASRDLTADTTREATLITLLLKSDRIVNLGDPDAGVTDADLTGRSGAAIAAAIDERAAQVLDDKDIIIDAYDADGRALGILPLAETANVVVIAHRDPTNPGREFLIRVDETKLTDAYTAVRAGGAPFEIHTLLFSIPAGSMEQADIAYVTAKRSADGHAVHSNKAVPVFRVDLVDDDEGLANYGTDLAGTPSGAGVPGVVAIQQLRERSGFIEAGAFPVRVILTEEPKEALMDIVAVANGSVTSVAKGATLKGAATAPATQDSELTTALVPNYVQSATGGSGLPAATGRDNMYHQYFVTVTPNAGFDGYVTVSMKQFSDKVLPVGNMYVPLSDQEILATTLTTAQAGIRDARVANESLMVRVHTIADAKVKAATDAYDARQKIYDANPLIKVLGNKIHIPAGGYLVLAKGKTDSDPVSGVVNVSAKIKDRKTAAQMLYNVVYDFGLPFPADDLSNFFRNGGTLTLAYQDIPEATGSGHGDSKEVAAVGHDDDTGYRGATTNAYAAGALIINEVMWGLDANSPNSQYIELYNPGTTAVGIDNKEWTIVVGGAPAGFTAIDTVGNNPASGFWQAPGSDGVSTIEPGAGFFALVDIVSMSRVADSADGTAAASWAMSTRPSANLGGRRVGTPGAANAYDTSAKDAAAAAAAAKAAADAAAAAAATASPATAGDLMISEIMIASNAGRLPQWIEITNTSVGEVSLAGWMVGIDNDSADADVVATSLSIKLDGVTLGAGQSALVVSKTSNRNSGVAARSKGDANAGALDSNRIVDASSQIKPASMTYSMLSEMSFRISLEPPLPLTGGATVRGDVVGNLGGGWELPMSEAGRSSIIRREMGTKAEIMGTDAAGWKLASDTSLVGAYVATYYGDKDDMGTPGYDAGGALPVELSKFGAKRDPLTGQVIVTWETQSELNNAGFFIKRSQQKNAKFVAVNPTMIPGAGTTSEKQMYTYTDTTAQPNIVYYYQIEDVSLDGQRQTLTRAHRLKGHVGAAGKLTTLWGELKDQE